MEIKSEFAEQLLNCKWLQNRGKQEELGFEVEYVKSKTQVRKLISSIKWENVCLEAEGDFTAYLHINHKEDYNKYWNDMVRLIKNEYIGKIADNIQMALDDFDGGDDIIIDMKSNLVSLFMMNFYSEYYESDFYDKMLKIYLAGHIPCGWIGKYPEGKFQVY